MIPRSHGVHRTLVRNYIPTTALSQNVFTKPKCTTLKSNMKPIFFALSIFQWHSVRAAAFHLRPTLLILNCPHMGVYGVCVCARSIYIYVYTYIHCTIYIYIYIRIPFPYSGQIWLTCCHDEDLSHSSWDNSKTRMFWVSSIVFHFKANHDNPMSNYSIIHCFKHL